jgi:hypothetical protein
MEQLEAKSFERLRRPGPGHVAVAGAHATERREDRNRVPAGVEEVGLDDRIDVKGAGPEAVVARRERPQCPKGPHQGAGGLLRQQDLANQPVGTFRVPAKADSQWLGGRQRMLRRPPGIMWWLLARNLMRARGRMDRSGRQCGAHIRRRSRNQGEQEHRQGDRRPYAQREPCAQCVFMFSPAVEVDVTKL